MLILDIVYIKNQGDFRMSTKASGSVEPQKKTLKLKITHPFLSNIASETIKVKDQNGEEEPKIDLSLKIEADKTASDVLELDDESVKSTHVFKLKSGVSGLIMVEDGKGLTAKVLPQANAILISTPQNSIDYLPLTGQNALLVASESGWNLEAVGDCDQV